MTEGVGPTGAITEARCALYCSVFSKGNQECARSTLEVSPRRERKVSFGQIKVYRMGKNGKIGGQGLVHRGVPPLKQKRNNTLSRWTAAADLSSGWEIENVSPEACHIIQPISILKRRPDLVLDSPMYATANKNKVCESILSDAPMKCTQTCRKAHHGDNVLVSVQITRVSSL